MSVSESQFILANKIANFAANLDFDKSILDSENQKSVSEVIETLYDLAEKIAGNRSEELYQHVVFTEPQLP